MMMRSVLPFLLALPASSALAADWPCQGPQPGHPTAAERRAFVSKVSELALAAERKHGVPASAIAAMAIVESSYGWTRVGRDAHNLLGWKYIAAQAGGRPAYVLACQPYGDGSRQYTVFRNEAESIDYVAEKLATRPAYRSETLAYQAARQRGAPLQGAVDAWLSGVADPFKRRPLPYLAAVKKAMAEHRLLTLSKSVNVAAVAPAVAQSVPGAAGSKGDSKDELVALATSYFAARIPTRNCDLPEINLLHWEGFPVQSCAYAAGGVAVRTYMLNPSAEQLARWTVTACLDARAAAPRDCIGYLARQIMASSGGVFAVAGFIPAAIEAGNGRGAVYCHLYRNGVMIHTDNWKDARRPNGTTCGQTEEIERPARFAKAAAHLAATTRQEYRNAGGIEAVGNDNDGNVRWLEVVRLQYQQAWGNDRNALITAKAKSARGQAFQ
jgi:hypothetical protein